MPKSVLITGCSENTIGNALAVEFARRGWTVYASARSLSKMSNLRRFNNVHLLALDVNDGQSVLAARDLISKKEGGKLDMLYHNAGVLAKNMAIDYSEKEGAKGTKSESYFRDDDTWLFNGNVISVMALTRSFSELVVKAKGTIVVTGSGVSRAPMPGQATYNASKAAVEMYTRTLRLEMQPLGVKVVYVMTGSVATPMQAQTISIPKDSLYAPIAQDIIAGWEPKPVKTSTQDYSRYVVDRVVRDSPPATVWAGDDSSLLWFLEKFGLSWVMDGMFTKRFGLGGSIL